VRAVSDSSVLIALSRIGQLSILPALFTSVGILLWARRHRLVACLRDQLDALQSSGGFRLGEKVRQAALRAAGEWPAGQ